MKLFFGYIQSNIRIMLLWAVFCAVFAVTFLLYDLPLGAVLYPAAVCAVIGAVYLFIRFRKSGIKHKMLEEAKKMTYETMLLPEPDNIFEEDYRKIIEKLKDDLIRQETEKNAAFSDMTDYYTMWAHQIKTPVASMKLAVQNEDSPLARRIASEIGKVEQYVEMVMAYLRLGSESSDYVFRLVELDDLIRGVLRGFSSDFILRKLRLEYEPTGVSVITDEKWFSFVLGQLVSNALKYTREGSIRIYTEGHALHIADTGIGIAPEDLPRIFEKGYTGINGRDEKHSSGIGLYLCKRICKNLNIGITVRSEIGKGTEVILDTEQYDLKKE